jgi:hypothetical protein
LIWILEIKHNDGPVVISGQGLLSNIQLTTPNNIIANCSLFESFAVSNEFLNGNINMNSNNITNIGDLVDTSGNNKIDMNVGGFTNAIDITTSNEVKLIQTTANNFISISGGGTNLQNNAGTLNIANNAGTVDIDATTAITGEAEQIDFNYTTTNFKVRNGLTNNFVIEPTEVKSFLNFVCPIFAGVADSLVYNPSIDGAIEKSIMPTSIVGSLTVPANGFAVGDSFHLVLAGDFSANNGDTLNIRLYGGPTSAVLLADLPVPLLASSGVSFEIEVDFQLRTIGGAGVADICSNFDFTYNGGAGTNFRGERGVFQNNTTFSTLTDNILLVTAQYSSTNANNSMKTIVSKLSKTY